MKFRSLLSTVLLALLAYFGLFSSAQAQNYGPWQSVCWGTNWSNYAQVQVSFTGTDCGSDYRSNMTVNGSTMAEVGNGSCNNGSVTVSGSSGVSLGWVYVGHSQNWPFIAAWNPSISYSCNPVYEDTGRAPTEGYFSFQVRSILNPTLSVSKSANPYTLKVGASGQYYYIYIGVSNGPTTAAISIADTLPSGFTTSGAISATGGTIYGCPAANASNLSGCTIAAGAYGPITITIPVNISSAAGSYATNYAYVYGGGDPNCNGGCVGGTTNPVAPSNPALSLTKALGANGRVNTGDQFTLAINTGGVSGTAVASVTTTGTGTTATGIAALNPAITGTTYTITEAASGGANLGQYSSTLSCTDSAGLQTGLPSNAAFVAGTGYTLTPVAGAQISCTITNTPKLPSITLDQTVTAGLALPASYQYAANNGWATQNVSSTVAGAPGPATAVQNLTAAGVATTFNITNLPAGLAVTNGWCYDTNYLVTGNSSGAFGSYTTNGFTIDAANIKSGSVLVCHTQLNLAAPTIVLNKQLSGNRINSADQFTVKLNSGATTVASATTTGSGSSIANGSTGIFVATAATSYSVNEAMASGSSSVAQYAPSVSCTNTGAGGTSVASVAKLGDSFTANLGDVISCTITNAPKAPTIAIYKVMGGNRINNNDQFVVSIYIFGAGVQAQATTGGSGSTVTGGSTSFTAQIGTSYMFGELMAAGSVSSQQQYDIGGSTCTNSLSTANGGTDVSVGMGIRFGPLVAGDDISCRVINTPKQASITLDQTVGSGIALPATYQYTGNNGWLTQNVSSTVAGVAGTATPLQSLTAAALDTVITPALPAGLKIGNAYCTDSNYAADGNSSGSLGNFTDSVFTIPAANVKPGAVLVCHVVIGLANPTIVVSKQLNGNRINSNDQFTVQIRNGAGSTTLASASTAGTGSTITGGSTGIYVATAGTAYSINEAMVSGSGSSLGQYAATANCSNSGVGGSVVTAVAKPGDGFSVAAGDVISCTITNGAALTKLTVRKISIGGTGSFTFNGTAANANGFSTNNSYVLSTTAQATPASGSTVNLAASNTLTEVRETLPASWVLSSASCLDNHAAATGNPASFGTLSGTTLQIPASNVLVGSDLVCTFTNAPAPTLTVSQKAIVTAPATFNPPETFGYTGNNGWIPQQNSSTILNTVTKGLTQTLSAVNLATTLTVSVPTVETGWKIASIRCTDTNAAVSGNPATALTSSMTNTVTIAANYVVANAALQCAVIATRQQQ